jgi:hypothetical protein
MNLGEKTISATIDKIFKLSPEHLPVAEELSNLKKLISEMAAAEKTGKEKMILRILGFWKKNAEVTERVTRWLEKFK